MVICNSATEKGKFIAQTTTVPFSFLEHFVELLNECIKSCVNVLEIWLQLKNYCH